jgi:putative acetyltransferase
MIRSATPSDAPGICAAHVSAIRVSNREAYSAEQIEAWAGPRKPEDYQSSISDGRLFVADEAGIVAGFGEYRGDEICAVYVHPNFTRRGIGRRLFRRVVQELARLGRTQAWLDASLPSVAFYRAMGCTGESERVHRVGGRVDLRCMRMGYRIGGVVVCPEKPNDIAQISAVVEQAFRPYSKTPRSEPYIVTELRDAGALALSLVASLEGLVVGHAAFSRVQVSDGTREWYGLGPLAVAPEFQRRGIGRALVLMGLAEIEKQGAAGCVVLGDPAYYGRFGFSSRPDLQLPGVPLGHFQSLAFGAAQATGSVGYHHAFSAENPDSG